ncbi:acyl carrier protein [Candidatus Methylopumilus planktonicus]|uniref:acyl carrier protein n=1 Tax=Candidatus Methylopumilus planktonicus TaxID=1581557 RepID=UPI003D18E552
MNIIEELVPIFRNVFDDDELIIDSSTTAIDVDGWDSLAHIRLIVAIEKHFGFQFSAAEIVEIDSVGEMADLILIKNSQIN